MYIPLIYWIKGGENSKVHWDVITPCSFFFQTKIIFFTSNPSISYYFQFILTLIWYILPQIVGLPNNSYKPITNMAWVGCGFVNYKKGCTRFTAPSDKVYQLLAHGRLFSPGTTASSLIILPTHIKGTKT
jgi:hypothetical protein